MKTSNYPEIEYWARLLKEDGIVEGVGYKDGYMEIDDRSLEKEISNIDYVIPRIVMDRVFCGLLDIYHHSGTRRHFGTKYRGFKMNKNKLVMNVQLDANADCMGIDI